MCVMRAHDHSLLDALQQAGTPEVILKPVICNCEVVVWSPTDRVWEVSILPDASVISGKCAAGGSAVVAISPSF